LKKATYNSSSVLSWPAGMVREFAPIARLTDMLANVSRSTPLIVSVPSKPERVSVTVTPGPLSTSR
jgi:hypothetical protein